MSKVQVSGDKVGRYCTGFQGVREAKNVKTLLSYILHYHMFW